MSGVRGGVLRAAMNPSAGGMRGAARGQASAATRGRARWKHQPRPRSPHPLSHACSTASSRCAPCEPLTPSKCSLADEAHSPSCCNPRRADPRRFERGGAPRPRDWQVGRARPPAAAVRSWAELLRPPPRQHCHRRRSCGGLGPAPPLLWGVRLDTEPPLTLGGGALQLSSASPVLMAFRHTSTPSFPCPPCPSPLTLTHFA